MYNEKWLANEVMGCTVVHFIVIRDKTISLGTDWMELEVNMLNNSIVFN